MRRPSDRCSATRCKLTVSFPIVVKDADCLKWMIEVTWSGSFVYSVIGAVFRLLIRYLVKVASPRGPPSRRGGNGSPANPATDGWIRAFRVKNIYYSCSKYKNKITIKIIFDNFFELSDENSGTPAAPVFGLFGCFTIS